MRQNKALMFSTQTGAKSKSRYFSCIMSYILLEKVATNVLFISITDVEYIVHLIIMLT